MIGSQRQRAGEGRAGPRVLAERVQRGAASEMQFRVVRRSRQRGIRLV